jgi:hypothetical protein
LNLRLVTFNSCICLGLSFTIQTLRAQAPIDPSLGEAPLPHTRALFLFPGYDTVPDSNTPVAQLRPGQKFEMAFRSTADLSFLIRVGMTSEFDKALGVGPFYGPGGRGFSKLSGYNGANLAAALFFTEAALPVVFHQDPRYFRKSSGSIKSRVVWALRSEVVAYGDRGKEMPNYSSLLGLGMSAVLSDAYLPPQNVSVGKTFEGYGIKEGVGFGLNLLHEFGGAIHLQQYLLKRRARH